TIVKFATSKGASPEVNNILLLRDELWMTNGRHVSRLNTITGEKIILGEKYGFGNAKLFPHSLTLTPWGQLLIGSHDGIFAISPEKIRNDSKSMPAYLTEFRVFDKPIRSGQAISKMDHIHLSRHQNFFS